MLPKLTRGCVKPFFPHRITVPYEDQDSPEVAIGFLNHLATLPALPRLRPDLYLPAFDKSMNIYRPQPRRNLSCWPGGYHGRSLWTRGYANKFSDQGCVKPFLPRRIPVPYEDQDFPGVAIGFLNHLAMLPALLRLGPDLYSLAFDKGMSIRHS